VNKALASAGPADDRHAISSSNPTFIKVVVPDGNHPFKDARTFRADEEQFLSFTLTARKGWPFAKSNISSRQGNFLVH
jgi:hypothetical protein